MAIKATPRRRVSAEAQRATASARSSSISFINLPKGVTFWEPQKAQEYLLNFLPYVIQIDNHPDRKETSQGPQYVPGDVWYRFPFKLHRRIGPSNADIVCPGTFQKKCPICEERTRLSVRYNDNIDQIKELNAKEWVAYILQNPEDSDAVCLFVWSAFKFADALDEEIQNTSEENIFFYEPGESGRTVKARFKTDSFDGRGFLKAAKIDFAPRPEMDEDEIFSKVPCLDTLFNVMEYEPLKKLFLQLDPTETPAAGSSSKTGKASPQASASGSAGGKPSTSKKNTTKEPEDDPDARGDGIEAFKNGDIVKFKNKGTYLTGKIIDIDVANEKLSIETPDKHEYDKDYSICELVEEAEPETEEEQKPEKPSKPAPKTAKAGKFKIGQYVKDPDGDIGSITAIDEDGSLQVNADGKEWFVEPKNAELVDKPDDSDSSAGDAGEDGNDAEFAKGDRVSYTIKIKGKSTKHTGKIINIDKASGDAKIKSDDGETHTKDIGQLTKEEAEAEEASEEHDFQAGQTVTWSKKGKEFSGEVIRVNAEEKTVKVKKDDDETEWIDAGLLTLSE